VWFFLIGIFMALLSWPLGYVLIFIGVAVALYAWAYYGYFFHYCVGDKGITINSGILFRESKTIGLEGIQNVTNTRGPVQMLFGVATTHLWTASPGQIDFPEKKSKTKADGEIYLPWSDADWLKEHYLARRKT